MPFVFEDKQPERFAFEDDGRFVFEDQESISDRPIVKDFIKPTLEAVPRVAGAVAGSLALLPGAGIAALSKLLPRPSKEKSDTLSQTFEFGSLKEAGETFDQIMGVPGKLIKTPEQAEAVETIGLVTKPFEMAGEGWRLIGEQAEKGLKELGFENTHIEPILATMGEAAAIFAVPGVLKGIKESTTFRNMTIPERGVVIQSLSETMAKNPGMTEGQILRKFNNPTWQAEAFAARGMSEQAVALKKAPPVKPEPVKAPEKVKPAEKAETEF